MAIYTRTGDTGETALFGGGRSLKSAPRFEAVGTVDELNGQLGTVIAYLSDPVFKDVRELLVRVQRLNFVLGAQLARKETKKERKDPELAEEDIVQFERLIDGYEKELPPLTNFILPGGSIPGAFLHVARSVCRRAERAIVRMHGEEEVPAVCLRYINRLSDLLFVLARVVNKRSGGGETVWKNPNA